MIRFFLTMLAVLCSSTAIASETVYVVYPWHLGDPMANYSRTLIEQANHTQSKYLFVLDNKPGAGGAIGAKYVAAHQNTILAGSTAFFVRPNVYPNDSHNINEFRVLMTQCSVPMVVSSSKYKSWNDVPTDAPINIGVSGLGATTHLISLEIKRRYPLTQPVPYKSTKDSTLDLAGQRIDLNVGFPGEIDQWVTQGKLYVLGTTGKKIIPGMNIPTLESQGFSGLGRMSNGHSLIVSKKVDPAKFAEWRQILAQASLHRTVQQSYESDFCDAMNYDMAQTQKWYDGQVKLWKELSSTVKLDQ